MDAGRVRQLLAAVPATRHGRHRRVLPALAPTGPHPHGPGGSTPSLAAVGRWQRGGTAPPCAPTKGSGSRARPCPAPAGTTGGAGWGQGRMEPCAPATRVRPQQAPPTKRHQLQPHRRPKPHRRPGHLSAPPGSRAGRRAPGCGPARTARALSRGSRLGGRVGGRVGVPEGECEAMGGISAR